MCKIPLNAKRAGVEGWHGPRFLELFEYLATSRNTSAQITSRQAFTRPKPFTEIQKTLTLTQISGTICLDYLKVRGKPFRRIVGISRHILAGYQALLFTRIMSQPTWMFKQLKLQISSAETEMILSNILLANDINGL
jgi:hypothetical protein